MCNQTIALAASRVPKRSSTGLELHVIGGISGDLCCTLLAQPTWTVSRLKGEIANACGTPIVDQVLLSGSRRLRDSEVVAILDPADGPLKLLRVPRGPTSVLGLTVQSEGGVSTISWTVDLQLLRRRDGQAVSPHFDLDLGRGLPSLSFKIFISPWLATTFRRANGRARVQVKCISDVPEGLPEVSCHLGLEWAEAPGVSVGPIPHNFGRAAVCSPPVDFDLGEVGGNASGALRICLQITEQASAGGNRGGEAS